MLICLWVWNSRPHDPNPPHSVWQLKQTMSGNGSSSS